MSLILAAALGVVGLGVDLGAWYAVRRQAQNAADSAAYSAVVAGAGAQPEARAVARRYGFVHGEGGASVAVNQPPLSGDHAGAAGAVEVVVSRPAPRLFSGLFLREARAIRARAVAVAGRAGDACVIALHETASASASQGGSTHVRLAGCSLYANSASASAFELKGGASFEAVSVGLVGGYTQGSNAGLSLTDGIRTGQRPIEDPYRDVPLPAYSGCTYNNASLPTGTYGGGGPPLVFCNGLRINSGVTVTLRPGIYVIDRGALQVNGGATLRGEGVTIVLTSSTGSNYATAQINGGSVVELSAPASGPTAGLVLYQDRRAPAGGGNTFNGGSTQMLRGAVYFPRQSVTFTGGSDTSASGCTQLLASQVEFKGNSTLAVNCAGTGVRPTGGASPALVE